MTRAPLIVRPPAARPASPAWIAIAGSLALALSLAATEAAAQDPDHDVATEQDVPAEPADPPAEQVEVQVETQAETEVDAEAAVPATPPATPAVDAQAVRREGREAVDALREYTARNREAAVVRAQAALAALDHEALALEDRIDAGWASMDAAARARARASMREVAKRRTEAAEWVGGLRHASEAAWGDVREGFNRSQATLSQAVRDARREFGDAPPAPAPEREPAETDEDFQQDDPDYRESRDAPA